MTDSLEDYFGEAESTKRIEILDRMRENEQWVPLGVACDLMNMKLSDHEKMSLIRAVSNKQNLAFEDFLTRNISHWNQNVASAALWEWAVRSSCVLWHRTLPLSSDPHLSQRVSYTLLDLAWFGGGARIVENFASWDNLSDLSPAFLSLLYFRALQWGVHTEKLESIAIESIKTPHAPGRSLDKTEPYFLAYLYRFAFKKVEKMPTDHKLTGILTQYHGAVKDEIVSRLRINAIEELSASKRITKTLEPKVLQSWPMIWERHLLSPEAVAWIWNGLSKGKFTRIENESWEFFAGISSQTLIESLDKTSDSDSFLIGLAVCGNLIHSNDHPALLDLMKSRIQNSENPANILSRLPQRFSTLLNSNPKGNSAFDRVLKEQNLALTKATAFSFTNLGSNQQETEEGTTESQERQAFFDLAYRRKTVDPARFKGDGFWASLIQAWHHPKPEQLDSLSSLARQAPTIFQLCYIDTLGRFKGIDNAALKLLDYIRSREEDVLRATIYALAGIGTNRAHQELVAFLTRPNVSFDLQMEITQALQEADLSMLQAELRSAINDLEFVNSTDNSMWELREAISTLLTVSDIAEPEKEGPDKTQSRPTTENLDMRLSKRIDDYHLLSGEVKRALRTAQFFHLQVEKSGNLKTIDLSPAIDMQYKALELSFREKFESATGQLIRQGVLQRKLDVIGYARPIPRAMDEFEH